MSEICPHMNFAASVDVGRIVADDDPNKLLRFSVEVRAHCVDCGIALEFQGLPMGVDTHGPTISPDGLEARLVAVPKGGEILATGRIAAIFQTSAGQA